MSAWRPMAHLDQFEEMKRYVRFGPEDVELLAELCVHARPHFEAIAREFYERNREHEEAHAVFQDEAQIHRLHRSLVAWLERVLSGPYDAAYCAKSLEIGRVHVRVGLPQRYVFGGMTLFRERLQAIAAGALGERAARVCTALSRILDIELALINATYLEAALERARRAEEEQRRATMQKLEQVERRYVQAVELAGAVIVGLDADGRVQLWNREAARVTGYPADEVIGRRFAEELVLDQPAFDDAWRAIAEGQVDTAEINFGLRTRAHRVREIEGELSRGHADGGDVMHILAGKDVTNDKLLAGRLRQSERLAAVGTLAAGLAHEIRNPLNGAQLHLTYLRRALQRGNADGDLAETVDVVASEIKRLSALVSEFLSFARPGELAKKPTSVRELCSRSLALVGGRSGEVALALEVPDSDVVAELDAEKVEQVLLNLLSNALDAAAQGGSKVTLRAYREPRFVVLEVEDDGPGLSSPGAPIFDAFYSTKAGGTGLGLAIVHRIVTDHDGSVDVSRDGDRTVFRVRLPLGLGDAPDSTPTPEENPS